MLPTAWRTRMQNWFRVRTEMDREYEFYDHVLALQVLARDCKTRGGVVLEVGPHIRVFPTITQARTRLPHGGCVVLGSLTGKWYAAGCANGECLQLAGELFDWGRWDIVGEVPEFLDNPYGENPLRCR